MSVAATARRTVVFPATEPMSKRGKELLVIPEKTAEFAVGDLVWVKVMGFPFWPCLVTICPLKGVYTEKGNARLLAANVILLLFFAAFVIAYLFSDPILVPFSCDVILTTRYERRRRLSRPIFWPPAESRLDKSRIRFALHWL